MNIELLPNLTNVVRFPLEERARPSYEVMTEIAPDIREVAYVAESFGLDGDDIGLKDATDWETAVYIADHITPIAGTRLNELLDELMKPALERAVLACHLAHRSSVKSAEAHHKLNRAQVNGGYWTEAMEEKVTELTTETARLLIQASARCEEVRGMRRAVEFARKGEPWVAYDPQVDQAEWVKELDEIERRRRERSTSN